MIDKKVSMLKQGVNRAEEVDGAVGQLCPRSSLL